jgi:ectoine hydroxylase-related dioxygenase (phytanoyl-CoA dioxygenase family)
MDTEQMIQRRPDAQVPASRSFDVPNGVDELAAICSQQTRLADYPAAYGVLSNVLVYDCDTLRESVAEPSSRRAVRGEWARALLDGPGVIALRAAFADSSVLDAASAVFHGIIAEQHACGHAGGDHFAKPGANDRVWNALEKLCLRSPETFAAYYANDMLALVCEAWLGPDYQVTSQINVVNPGGQAQSAHSDYHLGFMTPAEMERYPDHVHRLSPLLTLQGAVAHGAMPLESGPTLYLPYSQRYEPGYVAVTTPAFRAYFTDHHVQLALAKGDAVFFNPALFHAAGANRTTGTYRMANLLQISSAFGRAMETVDRTRMSGALYPTLLMMTSDGRLSAAEAAAAVAACAEGYPFPTNLDRDPPIGGLAPLSQQALMLAALAERRPAAAFRDDLIAQHERRLA